MVFFVAVGGTALAAVETENKNIDSIEDGVWWAIVTITTVGYGDVTPETLPGRAIASVVMVLGIGFVALLTATVAATFVKQDEKPEEVRAQLEEISLRLGRIEQALAKSKDF